MRGALKVVSLISLVTELGTSDHFLEVHLVIRQSNSGQLYKCTSNIIKLQSDNSIFLCALDLRQKDFVALAPVCFQMKQFSRTYMHSLN